MFFKIYSFKFFSFLIAIFFSYLACLLTYNNQNQLLKEEMGYLTKSLVSFSRNLMSKIFNSSKILYHNPSLPPPPSMHVVLDNKYLDNFDNILIVGDIHGCYDELIELLDLAKKSSEPDTRILKLFVGDLVNKGPKSKEVLDYFLSNVNNNDLLAVRGNHDEFVSKTYFSYIKDNNINLNEEQLWIKDINKEHVDFLNSLPYTISLPKYNSIIVHAGLVYKKNLIKHSFEEMTKMRNVIYKDTQRTKILKVTDSDIEGEPWINSWRGKEHIYFGHDAKRLYQNTEYATGLDTGCVYGRKLTAVLIDKNLEKKIISVRAKKIYCDPFNRPPKLNVAIETK